MTRILTLTTLTSALILGMIAAACSVGPSVSTADCESICTADKAPGVCWYSDDDHGSGTCVCKNADGDCPTDGPGAPDAALPVAPAVQ